MQGGIAYGFCPGVSITGSLTINEEMCPTIRALANTNTPAIAVRTAQTTANGCGVSDELAHTIDTTGPEAIAYAVRMRAGCDGGARARWYRRESVELWQQVTTRRYSSQRKAAMSCVA